MSATVTRVAEWQDGKRIHYVGSLVFSGTYPASGGETITWVGPPKWTSNTKAVLTLINGIAGFVYAYAASTGKISVWVNTAGGANNALGEHTNASYVAGVTGDTIQFYMIYELR